jgi:hypothetical protein
MHLLAFLYGCILVMEEETLLDHDAISFCSKLNIVAVL